MKSKSLLLILCLSLVLLSVTSVGASDVDNMTVQTSNTPLDDIVSSDEADICDMGVNSDESNILNAASFNDLETLIENADEGSEINLNKDYSLGNGGHTIAISKSLTINGNGHTLDGDSQNRLFGITANEKSVVFKNLTFKNANVTGEGSVIFHSQSSTSLKFINCKFLDNNAWGKGGAIYSGGDLYIANSTFKSNWAEGHGGAIYCKGKTTVFNSSFEDNHMYGDYVSTENFNGAAIYSVGKCDVDLCTFNNNHAFTDGGAIYCEGETYIARSEFTNNRAESGSDKSYGGAIRSLGKCHIDSSTFKNNFAQLHGGAICADSDLTITGTKNEFTGNSVKIEDTTLRESDGGAIYCCGILNIANATFTDNSALLDGGAIYCEGDAIISDSKFKNNVATGSSERCFGGAIRIKEGISMAGCTFENNRADNWGGAIYSDKEIIMFDCNFVGNHAKYAGAVYTSTVIDRIYNSTFDNNHATSGDGGAFYIYNKCDPKFESCSFKDNTCTDRGGAIYLDSSSALLTISNCTFKNNKANNHGGAIYTAIIDPISHSTFINNTAISGNGGAIYINNMCDPEFISCRFEKNSCHEKGGAIYLDPSTVHLKISYCTFVDNDGNKGKSVYNGGYYDSVDMCWFGKNDPDFSDQFKIRGMFSDSDYEVDNYLKIAMKINDEAPYVGNPYKLTVYFYNTNGHDLKKDLLHAPGRFEGDGIFSNLKVDINDITCDVIFSHTSPVIIYGELNYEILDLSPNVRNKEQSKVQILSCDNVTYPDALKVTYNITNMAYNAKYMIENSKGDIVRSGNLTSPNTLIVENLDPDFYYSITIINPETWTTLRSDATAHFNVKIIVLANVTADNVTYGNDTTITLKSNMDGSYNVTVDKLVIEMEVVDGICVKQVNLKGGEYETHTIFSDEFIFNCTEASFSVYRAHPDFYLSYSSPYQTYGFVVVEQSLCVSDAGGYVLFYVNNEPYYNATTRGGTLWTEDLDVGTYLISAMFSGDRNYYPANDSIIVHVMPADNHISVSVADVTYGETALIVIHGENMGEYQLHVNGKTYNITVYGGVGNMSIRLNAGSYWANVTYDVPNYNPIIINAKFNVFKQKATITAPNKSYVINYAGKYSMKLKYANGTAFIGKKIIFTLNGKKIGSAITNNKGVATIKLTAKMLKAAKAGKKNLIIKLSNLNYQATKTVKITINKEKTKIYAKNKAFKAKKKVKKYSTTLKNSKGKKIAKAKVILKVKGKIYKATTNAKGKATFKIKKLTRKHKYTAVVKFKGNNYYKKVTKKVKIIVK